MVAGQVQVGYKTALPEGLLPSARSVLHSEISAALQRPMKRSAHGAIEGS